MKNTAVRNSFSYKYIWLALGAIILSALSAQAAVVTWVVADITGDSNVATTGTLVEAANFGGSGVPDVTINTVQFLGVDFPGGESPSNISGFTYDNSQSGNGTSTGGNIDVLTDFVAYSTNVFTHNTTLTGLTDGDDYLVQFFVNHPGTATERSTTIDDGNGNTAVIAHTGQYATGTFTAVGTTQTLTFTLSTNRSQLLSGYQLRAVPEPSALSLIALVGLSLLVRRRRA